MTEAARERLAARLGILATYRDQTGRLRETSADTRDALLAAMGHDPAQAAETLIAIETAEARRALPAWIVATADATLTLAIGDGARWQVLHEDGTEAEGRGGIIGPVPLGFHRLSVADQVTWILAAPETLPLPARGWGVTVPLYGLKPEVHGGIGSYSDLAAAAQAFADAGAGFLGINPVHAGFPEDPGAFSPYAPSHRRRLNTLHVEVGAKSAPGPLVDHAVMVPAQRAALARAFAMEGMTPEFKDWCAAEGEALKLFALHQALSEVFGPYWTDWPDAYQRPDTPEVARFAAAHADRLTFHAWAQWKAARQLSNAARAANGMAHGLYLDLAVGTHPAGAETWAEPQLFARGASLGAPPDAFSPGGQVWNLAPLDPLTLASEGFLPLAETLRAQLRFSRLLRIDHILGFDRAFWVPEGGPPGAYVKMPTEAMLAVVRIEAARAGAVVIGEDLGNIPDGFRGALAASGILGCRVAMFEQDGADSPAFRPARGYEEAALTSFGTHDLPTFRGWRLGRDVAWREILGTLAPEAGMAARAQRAAEVAAFDRAVGGGDARTMHAFLGETASRLVALQIEDILGLVEQPNLPGTVYEFPNWRRRLPLGADELGGADEISEAGRLMRAARR